MNKKIKTSDKWRSFKTKTTNSFYNIKTKIKYGTKRSQMKMLTSEEKNLLKSAEFSKDNKDLDDFWKKVLDDDSS